MDDQIIITVAKRIVLKYHRIWRDSTMEEKRLDCVRLHDSISQEELRRFDDMGVIDKEGYITKLYPLHYTTIRPVGFNS